MKKFFIFLCCIFPALLTAQNPESIAIKQVDSLLLVSKTLSDQGNFDQAIEVIIKAETLALEKLGRMSAAYGSCCHSRGLVNFFKQDYPEAEKWWLEAKSIREKTLGTGHPDYAKTLGNLASLYGNMGDFEKAEPIFLESHYLKEKNLGKEDPVYAASLFNMGLLYHFLERDEMAEPFGIQAASVQEKILGKENLDYAKSLSLLAQVYNSLGKYEKAEPLYLESIGIQGRVAGKTNLDYAGAVINLGGVYMTIGNFEKAEQYLLEAKAILETQLENKEHQFYFNCLYNLASAYSRAGHFDKAEMLLSEYKAYFEKTQDTKNSKYVDILYFLVDLYMDMGLNEKSDAIYQEFENKYEQVPEAENPVYLANSLLRMAYINFQKKHLEKSEMLCLKAKTIIEESGETEGSIYSNFLNTSGLVYIQMYQYEKAEADLLAARAHSEKSLGQEHPDYATSLDNLSFLYEKQKRYSESEPLLEKMFAIEQIWLSKATCYLSEFEIARYAASLQENRDRVCSYYIASDAAARPSSSLPALAYEQALYLKGFLLNSVARLNTLSSRSPETEETFRNLKDYRRRLAAEYSKPIAERRNMVVLEESAATAEKKLAGQVLGTGYAEATRQVKWRDVQATLKTGEAAIEFVHFQINFPEISDSILYAALLLLPGTEQPRFIPLFEAKQLETLINTAEKQRADWVNQVYRQSKNGQKSLYELIWLPMEAELAGVHTIYFSPSGQLYRLNPAAIIIPPALQGQSEATTLGERFRLIELGSTRQLAAGKGQQATGSGNDAMLFGGIQYEPDTTAMDQARPGLENSSVTSRSRGLDFASTDSTLRGGKWKYLPWTKVEVTALDGILTKAGIKTTMRKDYEASEEAFKSLGLNQPSPRILHLATHGFFFPDPKTTVDGGRWTADGDEPVFKMSDHPMIRSGLLLAGGNYAWEKGKPFKPEAEDGILTAYEISQMDLSHTELVVLSACETGLGDIQGNEGVYGLQRAFKIAGAKYLIMSLWQVPDFQTQQLMSTFYRHWLEDQMSIPDAFRAAQQAMQLKFKDPFFWAGFVLVE